MEPGQTLLLDYYLHGLGDAGAPIPSSTSAGLESLRADRAKYAGTMYADHLSAVLRRLAGLPAAT